MATDLLDKLERVERTVNIYSNEPKSLIQQIEIDIPLERLRDIVTPKDGDSLLYYGYVLDSKQLQKISSIIGDLIQPDFNLYYYVLECHGIYNWDKKS